jgi:hypothetical protein
MFLEEQQRFAPIADNHPDDAMVYSVAGRDGVDVNFGDAQRIANPGERARAIIQKKSQLGADLHSESRVAVCRPTGR